MAEINVLRLIMGRTSRDIIRNEWFRERECWNVVPVLNRINSARLRL